MFQSSTDTPVEKDYSKLKNKFSIIYLKRLSINILNKLIALTTPIIKQIFRIARLLFAIIRGITYLIQFRQMQSNQGLLPKFFMGFFQSEWSMSYGYQPIKNWVIYRRLKNLFNQAEILSGLSEKKFLYASFSQLISSEMPSLVALPEENIFYNSQHIIQMAHDKNIPAIIIPFTIVNTLEWAESFYNLDSFNAKKPINFLLAKAFPRWTLQHRNKKLILPAVHILACEYFKVAPKIPWLINSGPVDKIAVESQFMHDYYLSSGIDESKLFFTGSLVDDLMYEKLNKLTHYRESLEKKHTIKLKKHVVLIALPPDQFAGGKRSGCEFDTYNELIHFMVNTACKQLLGSSVIINLHPRVDYNTVRWLESLGAIIVQEPIENVVPLADAYVAVVSATIRLAINCGIPVINYDAYQYDYADFKNMKAVHEIKTKEEYKNAIDLLINSNSNRSKKYTCTLDGKSTSRMLQLIDQLTSR